MYLSIFLRGLMLMGIISLLSLIVKSTITYINLLYFLCLLYQRNSKAFKCFFDYFTKTYVDPSKNRDWNLKTLTEEPSHNTERCP